MSITWNRTAIDRFVRTLHLRHPMSPRVHACILNRFYQFVVDRSGNDPPSTSTVRAWLDARSREWPLRLVCHRARVVDRFLDWMVTAHAIPTNPFAEWRQQYGHGTWPIVRALLSPNPAAALEALRPLPPFGSFLGPVLRAHVDRMKALGYRYHTETGWLRRFDRFLQQRPDLTGQPLRALIHAWANAGSGVQHVWTCHACGHLVSKALRRVDATVEILHVDRDLSRQVREHHRRPYICTAKDLGQILYAARTLPSPRAPLRPLSVYTMVVLAVCAGLRLGELARLTVGDVQLDDGTIDIRETKFFKSRRLPLATSVTATLQAYLEARQQAGAPTQASAGLFWHVQRNRVYSRVTIQQLLMSVLRRAGLKPAAGKAGPRVHDLRHAFVARRMLTWYQEGINPQSRLPYLATYLGHTDVNSTVVYLTMTPELLQEASERFRQRGGRTLQAEGGRV